MPEKKESLKASSPLMIADEIYIKIWEQQQESIRQRWNVVTFYFTVSFAIFGFSLQNTNVPIAGTFQRAIALAIYWFGYLVYLRYADWSRFLRAYMMKMETKESTSITLQDDWENYDKGFRRLISVKRLFVYFGILYTIVTIVLWWLEL